MKMAYEQPKMMVELYNTNQYVAACGTRFNGWYTVLYDDNGKTIEFNFNGNTRTEMINTNNGEAQYYWVADETYNGQKVFLEFSAYYDFSPFLYADNAKSGYQQKGNNGKWIDGVGSLQVNNAAGNNTPGVQIGEFAQAGHTINNTRNYGITNPITGETDTWSSLFADDCLGVVAPDERQDLVASS